MYQLYTQRKEELLNYLQLYLSKKFRMNIVFEGIKKRLINNCYISEKQFNSIIKFIEREPKFKQTNRKQIKHYFRYLISSKNKKVDLYEPNTVYDFIQ